jgi:DNA-directed RNA polymerase specialized sigma24 family protein
MASMESNQESVGSRLASAWLSGQLAEAAGILIDEVTPRCVKSLLFKFNKLSYEDCEDCVECGIEKLMEHTKSLGKIKNPYSYVWTCALHEAMDIMRGHNQVVHFDPEWLGADKAEDDNGEKIVTQAKHTIDNALLITEIALEAEVGDSSQHGVIKEVLSLSISRLAKKRKHIIEVLLEQGAFISNEILAELTGMKDGAVRSLKSRAFNDLRILIPEAAKELGVDVTEFLAPEPDIFAENIPSVPSLDEDDESNDLPV